MSTANNTIQEWVQDLVEDDPLQLHVIPQIVLTGDTVRSVFANCSMLPETMPRCNYESLHIYIYIYIYIMQWKVQSG